MKQPIHAKTWDKTITVLVLLLTGIFLAIVGILLTILPFNDVMEVLLFSGFGYLYGNNVYGHSPWWGSALALPAILLLVYRTGLGGTSLENMVMILVLHLSACGASTFVGATTCINSY